MSYWFNLDMEIVASDTRSIVLTFSTAAGAPVDITNWTFYYKALNKVATGAGTSITIANSAMTKSNSGRGVTDTVTIPLDNSVTAVTAGKYDQEIAVKISSEPTTIAKGTLTVTARITSTA